MPSERKDAGAGEGRETRVEGVMDGDAREIVIVQPSATQVPILQVEPEGADEVEVRARSRTHSDGISRIRGDNGVLENNMGERRRDFWHT